MGWVRNSRECINVLLFNVRGVLFKYLNLTTLLFGLAGVGIIIYFFGFSPNSETTFLLTHYLQRVLDFFLLKFFIRLFFDFNPRNFLKENLWETILMIFLLSETLLYFAFGQTYWFTLLQKLGFSENGYFLFVQCLFWIVVLREAGRASVNIKDYYVSPAAILALSFLFLIVTGTVLLKMPEMTTQSLSWTDALFTSTSACCVTGLIVKDTATFFTFKGQLTIMLLFQFGGLNMLTIATFIGSFYRRSGTLQSLNLMREFLDIEQTGNLKSILRKVIYYSLAFEMIGALMLFFLWGDKYQFTGTIDRIFFSVFHSISAFNNAGFSLFSQGLFNNAIKHQYLAQIVIMVLIVAGGLGFIVLQDIFSKDSRKRKKRSHWLRLQVNTRLVLTVTGILLLSGSGLFFVLEYDNVLKDYSLTGKVVASLFQSVTTRTAGFNTVNISMLSHPTLLIFMFLMFIGASPGSTGGGIKTTTFAVALKAAWANIRGKEHVEIFRRNIWWPLVNKTYAIITLALLFMFVFTVLLLATNPQFSLTQLLFEQISAMGTVGLSLGITGSLNIWGKLILVVSMFVGRIGFLTMGIIFSRRTVSKNYRYPNARLMIG